MALSTFGVNLTISGSWRSLGGTLFPSSCSHTATSPLCPSCEGISCPVRGELSPGPAAHMLETTEGETPDQLVTCPATVPKSSGSTREAWVINRPQQGVCLDGDDGRRSAIYRFSRDRPALWDCGRLGTSRSVQLDRASSAAGTHLQATECRVPT
jgi:hypothetical protein